MIKSYLWFFRALLSLLVIFVRIMFLNTARKKFSENDYYGYTYKVAEQFCADNVNRTGSTIHVTGMENIPNGKSVLFVSNHQSHFDIGIFLGFIKGRKGFVAKTELQKFPIANVWMREIKCVFLDRDDIRKSMSAINEAIQNIVKGWSMVIFPEGTRSKQSKMGDFKAGSFKIATKANAPIVPVTIDGSYKILEGNNNVIKAADVYVTIHPPIETAELSKEETSQLSVQVKEIIESALTVR